MPKKTSINTILFDLIKQATFTFSGQCQHSGKCCQGIMLYDKGIPINSISDWKKFSSAYPEHKTFIPNIKQSKISDFSCLALTDSNICNQYKNRPTMCRQYPYSYFYQHGFIPKHCGYKVAKNNKSFSILFPSIKNKLNQFYINEVNYS